MPMASSSSARSDPATLATPAPPLEASGKAVATANIAATDSTATIRLLPFGFAQRTNFDAHQELQKTRSQHFSVPPAPPDNDIWRRPPPDFRPQAWAPRPPKRNSRDAVQPWRYQLESDARYAAGARDRLPALGPTTQARRHQPQDEEGEERPRMQTLFRLMRPDTAKRRFVQEGANARGPYDIPKPHDFREYPPLPSLGLPEFTTAADKDPYNIRFLTRNKDTIVGPLHDIQNIRDASGTMWSAVRHAPKWDPRLHLAQNRFPNRSCEYSRFRQPNRDPFVAFMDTVEAGLEKRWQAEKLADSTGGVAATEEAPTGRSAFKMVT